LTSLAHGFDSGESLDYVYRNRASARRRSAPDHHIYLNSPGWRGVRERRRNLETLLHKAIEQVRAEGKPVHIFDPAPRRALRARNHEPVNGGPMSVTLRDLSQSNVDAATKLRGTEARRRQRGRAMRSTADRSPACSPADDCHCFRPV